MSMHSRNGLCVFGCPASVMTEFIVWYLDTARAPLREHHQLMMENIELRRRILHPRLADALLR